MDFITELSTLRNSILAERDDERNKNALNKFIEFLTQLLTKSKDDVQTALINFVKNMPAINNPSITKEYIIPSDNNLGCNLFFNQEGGKHIKDFINSITKTTFKEFHITIKDSTEYPKPVSYSSPIVPGVAKASPVLKITVRYEVNL